MKFSKLSFKSLLIAFLLAAAFQTFCARITNGQGDDCKRRNEQGVCTDANWHIRLGDQSPQSAPIVILNAPSLSETQKRSLLGYMTGSLIKEYGSNIVLVTDERQIHPAWVGPRHVITFNYSVQSVAGSLEPVTVTGAVARSSTKAGLRMLDALVYSLPGNGRIASAGKSAGAEAAQEVGRAGADRAGVSRLNRDRTYAVTTELLRGDGKAFKALRPETQYFVIRELFDSQTGQVNYYLVGSGDHPKRITKLEPQVYLGYTSDAVDQALSEESFIQLFKQGGPVKRSLNATLEPAASAPDDMSGCNSRAWSKEQGRYVCNDQQVQVPPCAEQRRDPATKEWRCVVSAGPATSGSAAVIDTPPAKPSPALCEGGEWLWFTGEKVWKCVARVQVLVPGDMATPGAVPAPTPAPKPTPTPVVSAVPAAPTTAAAPLAPAGFVEIYYDSSKQKMQGENVKKVLAYMVNKNILGWNPAWDFAWGLNADRGWREVEAAAAAAGIPGIVQDGRVNASEWQWLSGLPPTVFALNADMQKTEARIKARQKK